MNKLERLCHPLIRLVCEYCYFAQGDEPLDKDIFRRKVQSLFSDMRERCENDIQLRRDFAKLERALVFFVDYTIKEGKLPFSKSWRELARDYNELSGDEKFFDLLAETLDDPDQEDMLKVFYLMLGLGFDGCHIGNPDYIERRMKLCATRFNNDFDVRTESLFKSAEQENSRPPKRWNLLGFRILLTAIILAILALAFNFFMFERSIDEYRDAVINASKKADSDAFDKSIDTNNKEVKKSSINLEEVTKSINITTKKDSTTAIKKKTKGEVEKVEKKPKEGVKKNEK